MDTHDLIKSASSDQIKCTGTVEVPIQQGSKVWRKKNYIVPNLQQEILR
jgi:hypothetical protein